MVYDAQLDRLLHPARITISPDAVGRPHRVAAAAGTAGRPARVPLGDFPVPTIASLRYVLADLPVAQRALVALIAAEMVADAWHIWAAGQDGIVARRAVLPVGALDAARSAWEGGDGGARLDAEQLRTTGFSALAAAMAAERQAADLAGRVIADGPAVDDVNVARQPRLYTSVAAEYARSAANAARAAAYAVWVLVPVAAGTIDIDAPRARDPRLPASAAGGPSGRVGRLTPRMAVPDNTADLGSGGEHDSLRNAGGAIQSAADAAARLPRPVLLEAAEQHRHDRRQRFIAAWWEEARRRLALRDATSATLQMQ
jgi:hypothetical protein